MPQRGEAGVMLGRVPCPLVLAPRCPTQQQHLLTGPSEWVQLLSPCMAWGWDPCRLAQSFSSDAILRRGCHSPPLPDAMESLHVLCSLLCLCVSVDL